MAKFNTHKNAVLLDGWFWDCFEEELNLFLISFADEDTAKTLQKVPFIPHFTISITGSLGSLRMPSSYVPCHNAFQYERSLRGARLHGAYVLIWPLSIWLYDDREMRRKWQYLEDD